MTSKRFFGSIASSAFIILVGYAMIITGALVGNIDTTLFTALMLGWGATLVFFGGLFIGRTAQKYEDS